MHTSICTSSSVINSCLDYKKLKSNITELPSTSIIIGTKYCGQGNISSSYTDLGTDPADICCREHDSCLLYVAAQETKYEYTNNNNQIYQVHCQCDQR